MTEQAQRIDREIRDLAVEDLLVLREHLGESIERKEDGLDPVHRAEIERRIAEVESGAAVGVDGFEVLRGL